MSVCKFPSVSFYRSGTPFTHSAYGFSTNSCNFGSNRNRGVSGKNFAGFWINLIYFFTFAVRVLWRFSIRFCCPAPFVPSGCTKSFSLFAYSLYVGFMDTRFFESIRQRKIGSDYHIRNSIKLIYFSASDAVRIFRRSFNIGFICIAPEIPPRRIMMTDTITPTYSFIGANISDESLRDPNSFTSFFHRFIGCQNFFCKWVYLIDFPSLWGTPIAFFHGLFHFNLSFFFRLFVQLKTLSAVRHSFKSFWAGFFTIQMMFAATLSGLLMGFTRFSTLLVSMFDAASAVSIRGQVERWVKGIQIILFSFKYGVNRTAFDNRKLKSAFPVLIKGILEVSVGMIPTLQFTKVSPPALSETLRRADICLPISRASNQVNSGFVWKCFHTAYCTSLVAGSQ